MPYRLCRLSGQKGVRSSYSSALVSHVLRFETDELDHNAIVHCDQITDLISKRDLAEKWDVERPISSRRVCNPELNCPVSFIVFIGDAKLVRSLNAKTLLNKRIQRSPRRREALELLGRIPTLLEEVA